MSVKAIRNNFRLVLFFYYSHFVERGRNLFFNELLVGFEKLDHLLLGHHHRIGLLHFNYEINL